MITETSDLWRYEIKYALDPVEEFAFIDWLCETPFVYRAFPTRLVNSLYLDTLDFDCAQLNLDGLGIRSKYRIRYYGAESKPQKTIFEIKKRQGRLSMKSTSDFPMDLPDFIQSQNTEREKILSDLLVFENQKETAAKLIPVLNIQYEREYFQAYEGIRITVDRKLKYSLIETYRKRSFSEPYCDPRIILEFKFTPGQAYLAAELMSNLPFSAGRSSKYMYGLDCHGVASYG